MSDENMFDDDSVTGSDRSRSRSRSPWGHRSRSRTRSRSRSPGAGDEQGAGAMGSEVRILPPWFCVCLTPPPASKDRFQWQIEEESNSQNFDTSEWLTSATGRRVAAQGGKQAALDIRRDPRAQERERETDRLSAAPRRSRASAGKTQDRHELDDRSKAPQSQVIM